MAQPHEGVRELRINNFLLGNLDPLEERLVEQAALIRIGAGIGHLHVLRQVERHIERIKHPIMLDPKLLNALLQPVPLTTNPGLLLGKQLLADLIGIVGLEQLAFLAIEPGQLRPGLRQLLIGLARQLPDVCLNRRPELGPLLCRQLYRRPIVLLNGRLHCLRPVIALGASAVASASARQILVGAAVATHLHVGQPTSAIAAIDRSPQVMEVPPGALAALALGRQ